MYWIYLLSVGSSLTILWIYYKYRIQKQQSDCALKLIFRTWYQEAIDPGKEPSFFSSSFVWCTIIIHLVVHSRFFICIFAFSVVPQPTQRYSPLIQPADSTNHHSSHLVFSCRLFFCSSMSASSVLLCCCLHSAPGVVLALLPFCNRRPAHCPF